MRDYLKSILINRDYALFTGGSFISATASWFLAVAIGWLVWELGRSELLLGAANFAQMGPMLLLGFVGGVVADRVERRRLILLTQTVAIFASGTLALLYIMGRSSLTVIFAALLLMGISQSFAWPAWSPLIADLVGPERLRSAIAVNSARFNLSRIIGPGVAGLLLSQAGAGVCLGVAALGQSALIVTMLVIHPRTQRRATNERMLAAIGLGLSLAWRTRAVRESMFLAAVIGAIVLPYVVFLPAYAEHVLQVGPQGYGFLLTAIGLGAIVGAVISGTHTVASRPRRAQGGLAILTGLALSAFAVSTSPLLSAAALSVVGLSSIGYLATANATVQLAVPRAVIGRVMGIWVVVAAGSTPLGGVALGWAAERLGLGPTLAVAGLVAATFTAGLMTRPGYDTPGLAAEQPEAKRSD